MNSSLATHSERAGVTDRREEYRAYRQRKVAEDPGFLQRERERNQRFREENRDRLTQERRASGQDRRYREKNREAIRQRRPRNGPVEAERRARYAHGPNHAEILTAMWEQQCGCCYLCGGELDRPKAVVDHDHTCCRTTKTCAICRRGFACQRCNRLIGAVGDDVELLRLIATNLERADRAVKARMASAATQGTLEGVPAWTP